MAQPQLIPVSDLDAALSPSGGFDAVVAVGPKGSFDELDGIASILIRAAAIDAKSSEGVHLHAAPELAGGRLIHSGTGPLNRDQDDVRCFGDAVGAGLVRARDAGAKRPLLLIAGAPENEIYAHAGAVGLLGALSALWAPLEAREALGDEVVEPIQEIGFVAPGDPAWLKEWVSAVEAGRRLGRDLGGTEPERMAPPRMADLMVEAFHDTCIKVSVISDRETLERDYPLLAGVARASWTVERHHARVVRLEYDPGGEVEETLLLAGKGLSYDTGGADLKVGGVMAGMSRDKCGGANAAGFMRAVASLRPSKVKVIAEIGCVRNSIGANCFVSDEILTSHAGTRVRIANTDAEGRLVLADLLSHLREDALGATNPRLFSIATLTGHSGRAVGPYSIALDNAAARQARVSRRLEEVGEVWGDPFELSRLRREDWSFVAPKSRADDVLSCNNAPSSGTARGHQFPMAFLAMASGLHRHGPDSDQPIAFTHMDIGGSATEGSDWQHGRPTATPIVAMAALWLQS